ncbi:type I polyketide synthase [Paracoccus zhejiangensis]|uniref:Phenolphthiocerol/phthiocerol polyketide synthase subunit E n=1 Tax=Paracoccus zhejiangensis TaxID=1077935 RepID=A0A2H5EX35_9RHOB|nr:type I polyketide synthase [Paracoccus zhejiangensis]AUH63833.1 polyketide synthase [Paracoccus zhejiangensis]
MNDQPDLQIGPNDIAVIGMAAQLPGADDVASFWRNLCEGVESIQPVSREDLLARGESPSVLSDPNYVPAAAILDQFDGFDAEFFGLSPKDAAIMDPQHRKFLETCWHGLEDAGQMPERFDAPIGVYAGCGMGSYFYFNICANRELVENVGHFLLRHTGNDKDFLSTRVSHIFNLTGPSVNVQTACSTSLVALHMACQSLTSGECDMALAGGVTIEMPHGRGYLFKENEILSPDGHCHAFDHRAEGTVFGSGSAVVVLRRLADALADGDNIRAIIRGSAINNDGSSKAGYLAPSVEGQAQAVAEALVMSGCAPDSIGYIECHGTGTALGDPIEIAALNQAFSRVLSEGSRAAPCYVGSVKTNIGHLDTAAGAAGLIKTIRALEEGVIPPTLGFEAPNPAIDFDAGPFAVADRLIDWRPVHGPRRAGINSLGVGGTNAHVVLEQPPAAAPSEESDWPFQIFAVSGRSKAALDGNAEKLAGWLSANPDTDPADISHTLINRRRAFERRRVLVAKDASEAAQLLASSDPYRVFDHQPLGEAPGVVFMLPGGGSQYARMARDLYQTEPVFRDWMDRGLDHLATISDHPIRDIWLAEDGDVAGADARLLQPSVQLPLLMITEYALAQQWMAWGVTPSALIGHSMGENTAAAVAGVMRFEDCIGLVHLRGRLFDSVPEGGMLSVPMPADQLRAILPAELDLGAVNAGDLCVVSGPKAPLEAFAATLAGQGIEVQVIPISIAAHSRMLEPILPDFGAYLRSIPLSAPQIPIISNRDGQVLPDVDAMDPDYWVRHLRGTVEFAAGIETLAGGDPKIFLEVGPGRAMSALAQANPGVKAQQVISSLRHPKHQVEDDLYFMTALARVWAAGGQIDWSQIWGDARRNALSLPGYAFQRKRYFVEPTAGTQVADTALMRIEEPEGWGWRPAWRLSAPDVELAAGGLPQPEVGQGVLIFADEAGLADRVADLLRKAGQPVATVRSGDRFERVKRGDYRLPPEEQRDGYEVLLAALQQDDIPITRIGHFWSVTTGAEARAGSSRFQDQMTRGFFSLLHLAQALGDEMADQPLSLTAFSNDALRVADEPAQTPEKATVLGPLRVMPREYPMLSTRLVDLRLPPPARRGLFGGRGDQTALDQLALHMAQELLAAPGAAGTEVAAWRDGRRFVQRLAPVRLEPQDGAQAEGVTFITGGFGGLGQAIARDLAARGGAKLALLSREALGQDGTVPFSAKARQMAAFLRELQAAGAEVIAVTGDVTSPEDMTRALAEARARFGSVDTVIHAAGIINDALMAGKADGEAWDVLAPKVHGTKALIAALEGHPPRQTVLFASTSTASAPAGQVDYVAANEFLNAVARAAPPALGRVVAVNWGVWADTGMAARAMGTEAAPGPAPQEPVPEADGGPMLGQEVAGGRGVREFHRLFSTADWVIGGHRTAQGQALMPGTGNLELFAQALVATGTPLPLTLTDALFLRPLYVSDAEPTAVSVQIETVEGASRITITDPDGGDSYATAMAERAAPQDRRITPPTDWDEQATGEAALPSAQDRVMRFGPRWRVLRAVKLGQGEGWAELRLPEAFAGEAAQHQMHPALLDIATGWAMKLIPGWGGARLWVPVGYERFTLLRPLGPHLLSHIRLQPSTAEGSARFDVTLALPDGTVAAEIEGFTLRRMEAGLSAATAAKPARGQESPGEKRLRHNVSQGIPGALGPDVLRRAVALGLPQVYVSSLDLPGLVAEAAAPAVSAPSSDAAFERPDLDAEFIAPAAGTESELASIWSELLGVRQIGAGDSFFDLGGHSLVAVRMFGQVRKVFGVDFPISTLFEAPNVGKLAALIEARVGPRAGTPATAGVEGGAALADPGPARRYVVDMGGREGGTPFFIVAGMFGNVMNLHQMAQRVGQDRRFYGLQARGLFGDDKPHESFAEAAQDYLAEIRQIQPEGPYLLGGFSGGGLIALEMARLLVAEGEETAMLVMLDTPLPMRPAISRRDKVLIRAQEMREQGLSFWSDWARNKLAYELSRRRKERDAEQETEEAEGFHDLAIESAFRGALPKVALEVWPGPVTLFRPPLDYRYKVSDGQFVTAGREYLIPDNGWGRWMPQLQVHEVPGDHDSMVLEPNVRRLGMLLREILRRHDRGGQQSAAAE